MEEKKEIKKGKRITFIKVLMIIVLVLLVIVGALFFTVNHYLGKINRTEPSLLSQVAMPEIEDFDVDSAEEAVDESGNPLEEVDADSIEWEEIDAIADDDLINIMLVGQDTREPGKRSRSDSMVLCSINPRTGKVSLISFLRDLYVELPGRYSDNRLNTAYRFGGFELLESTLAQNFGVSVDGNVEVDFESFIMAVDIIGGVEIELSGEEADVLGVKKGKNLLNGEQALDYTRIRKIDNDFNRTARQRNVIMAIINKVKTLGVSELHSLMNELLPCIVTDMTNEEIMSIAMKLIPMLKSLDISTYHVPGEDAYRSAMVNGMAVLIPDKALIRDQLNNEYLPLN